jgi:capsular polysaccharide biosynthesis protein
MIVQGLEASIDVDQEGYANIVVISVTDTNPNMARNLANRLAEV